MEQDNGTRELEDVRELIVRCECGFEVRGNLDALVLLLGEHGRAAHNMAVTREKVAAMARPA